jgi:hypothetical protein
MLANPVISAEDEAEIRRFRAEIGLNEWSKTAVKMHIAQAKGDPTSKRRLDMSSRRSRASHLKLRRPSAELLLLLRFLFLCFLRHSGAPVLRLGAGVLGSGLQAVSCPAEMTVFGAPT